MSRNDPKTPYNLLPKLPPNFNFDDIEILKLVNQANIKLSNLNGTARLLPNRFLLVAPLTLKEAVASSGIEDINTTVAEAFQAELFPEPNLTEPQKETLYYRDALMNGFRVVRRKQKLEIENIVDMQAKIEPDMVGLRDITKHKHTTRIINKVNDEIIYTPPEGLDLIIELLENYKQFLNDQSSEDNIDSLIRMSVLHYQFEAIHPFRDGNGRVGRMLMVLYLVLMERLDMPILFISKYILNTRPEYYRLIRAVTEENKWKEWIEYILKGVIEQSEETTKIILEIKNLKIANKRILAKHKNIKLPTDIMDYLFASPFYTVNDLAKKRNVHRNTAAKHLKILVEMDILIKTMIKGKNIYTQPRLLKALSR